MDDMIARSPEDYVKLALALARDADLRNDAVRRIEQRRGRLFEDQRVIEGWTKFLIAAIEASKQA